MKKIHDLCKKQIVANFKTYAKDVALSQAQEIEGLRAVFGETYPDPVRVVSIGVDVDDLLKNPTNSKWREYSVELCVRVSFYQYLLLLCYRLGLC